MVVAVVAVVVDTDTLTFQVATFSNRTVTGRLLFAPSIILWRKDAWIRQPISKSRKDAYIVVQRMSGRPKAAARVCRH